MSTLARVRFGTRAADIVYPSVIADLISALFLLRREHDRTFTLGRETAEAQLSAVTIAIEQTPSEHFTLRFGSDAPIEDVARDDLVGRLMDGLIGALVDETSDAVALHAGAVLWNEQGILVPGATMAGKTSLIAWLLDRGCRYVTDELVLVANRDSTVGGLSRAMIFKSGNPLAELPSFAAVQSLDAGPLKIVRPPSDRVAAAGSFPCGLVIFPHYAAGAKASITSLSAAEAGFRLMACNVNARNFADGGLPPVTTLARRAPAFLLRYGGFEQLEGTLDMLAELVLDRGGDVKRLHRFLSAFGGTTAAKVLPPKRHERQKPSPPANQPTKLTVGMATYDDYDGVYFTLQALRMYHAEAMDRAEIVLIDNHPDGPAAKHLKQFESKIANFRYIPVSDRQGTIVKEVIFREAAGEYVLCMDCHVLIKAGGVRALIDYFEAHPLSRDLIQGPLLNDNLSIVSTHQNAKWFKGMFGAWHTTAALTELPKEPLEIELQGMALFACRRDAWVGFNPAFRGWGIEEWYIHEKFRRSGGKIVCLPELQWIHRFDRPFGVPYRHNWEDRIRNYTIALRELGEPADDMEAHFRELLGKDNADVLIEGVRAELDET